MRKEQQQTMIDQFCQNLVRICLKDENLKVAKFGHHRVRGF